jgi:hypothetical protein
MTDDPVQVENEYCRWTYHERLEIRNDARNLKELPDMFIQLIDPDTEKPICFFRKCLSEFNEDESPIVPPHKKNTPL